MTTEQAEKLNELLDMDEGLTEWELEFIDSLDQKMRSKNLSDHQSEKLEQVYAERVERKGRSSSRSGRRT